MPYVKRTSYLYALTTVIMLSSTSAVAQPKNEDEAATGAAALIVLSQKCQPVNQRYYQEQAIQGLTHMIQLFDRQAQDRIFDNMNLKVKALTISSRNDTCHGAYRLHSFINQWGYAHYLPTLVQR